MRRALVHRGPNGQGVWIGRRLGLVHTRLAIIDLSDAAAQPMVSADGRFVVCYNGEIYNYRELRSELERRGCVFRTCSDTEVLLCGFAVCGPAFFARLEGMYAAALWDGTQLILVRDRFGMKPLFYARLENGVAFGSEPKALLAAGIMPKVRPQGVLEYLLLNSSLGDGCIFEGVEQIQPGTWAVVNADGRVCAETYWSIPRAPRPLKFDLRRDNKALEQTLLLAVRRHLVSDVPMGIFLSGGIDSALLATAAAKENARLHAFSMTFSRQQDTPYLDFAERLAARFGMQHHHVEISLQELPQLLAQMVELADEPLGDAADVAVYALSRKARNCVKAVLTGDGGDEVFGGYVRHRAELFARRYGKVLGMLRWVAPFVSDVNRRRLHLLCTQRGAHRYASYLMSFPNPKQDVESMLNPDLLSQVDFESVIEFVGDELKNGEGLTSILATDLCTMLPDTYLRKNDRASMMAGIESRLPFLDRALVELAFSLPECALVSLRIGKRVLRRLLAEWIPDHMASAPKMGFNIPTQSWLRSPELVEIRHDLAGSSSALQGLLSTSGMKFLIPDPVNPQQASVQWRLLRLGLWARRWLKSPQDNEETHAELLPLLL